MKSLFFFLPAIFLFSCTSVPENSALVVETQSIRSHLENIISTEQPRNYKNLAALNSVAKYIHEVFEKYSEEVYYQPYVVDGKEYKNVVCVFGNENTETIVVGAHYDVCGDQDGADDNATGVVGLLELAKLLQSQDLNHRIELVAYTLEEPPFFRTENMGSYVHAKSLVDKEVDVFGMFCLEMIGYFDDAKGSQDYPVGFLKWIYGDRGDYIALISKIFKGKFARTFSSKFKKQNLIKTKKLSAPSSLQGIDFSDHLNYWHFGYSALMITDTAFFRNKNYHEETDTIETLNLEKMAQVIQSVYGALMDL